MDSFGGVAFGGVAIFVSFFLFVLFLLWFILPFLIVGTNNRLNRLITLMNENNAIQDEIRADIKRLAGEAEKSLNK